MEGRSYEGDTSLRYRFGFNGKEKDNEIYGVGNEMDFGARVYDARIGRWLSVDRNNQFVSPYLNAANSPIVLADKDGNWVPGINQDGQVVLTREEGDNYKSLMKFFGGIENAKKYLNKRTVTALTKKGDIVINKLPVIVLSSNNNYSKAVMDAFENDEEYMDKQLDQDFHSEDNDIAWGAQKDFIAGSEEYSNYNCHTLAIYGSRGCEIDVQFEMGIEERNSEIEENYENTGANDAVFGQTIITFGIQHDAVYFGTDSKGNQYVLTKNGWAVEPQIMKLSVLENRWNYGPIRNPKDHGADPAKLDNIRKSGRTGYFNLKKESESTADSTSSENTEPSSIFDNFFVN